MLNPAEMKNKGEVIASIQTAQAMFDEEPTLFNKNVLRSTLESLLLSYVERYRSNEAQEKFQGTAEELSQPRGFVTIACASCEGTGVYAPNGGPCFRCTGKGHQTEEDQKRNYGYDLHHPQAPAPVQSELPIEPHVAGTVPSRVEDYDPDDIPF